MLSLQAAHVHQLLCWAGTPVSMHHEVEASLSLFRSYVRTKAISRKLAKRKAELESEAYQVGLSKGATLQFRMCSTD